jgi:phage terminase large subunit
VTTAPAAAPPTALPANFRPRDYQERFVYAATNGCTRAALCWHRRAGKDLACWNVLLWHAARRVGSYFYVYPTYRAARRYLWNAMHGGDDDRRAGFRYLDHIPPAWLLQDGRHEPLNDGEMLVRLANGSTVQLLGAGAEEGEGRGVDALRGGNPVGVVLSEFSQMPAGLLDVLMPILLENDGFLFLNFTPFGGEQNHATVFWERFVKHEPGWFWSLLTVADTRRPDGRPVIAEADLEGERRRGVAEEIIQQEYYCSFAGASRGSYYGKLLEQAEREGRVGHLPYDPANGPVYTSWDLGARDMTAIWFFQVVGPEFLYLDFYQNSGEDLAHYAVEVLRRPATWRLPPGHTPTYGAHYLPHEAGGIRQQTARTDEQLLREAGLRSTRVVKVTPAVGNRIELVRSRLPLCRFDLVRCREGLDALRQYRREWDDANKTYRAKPLHDWASHPADAFGCGHEGWRPLAGPMLAEPTARAPGYYRG